MNQAHLERVIRTLFPKHGNYIPTNLIHVNLCLQDVRFNSRKHAKIRNYVTGSFLELDVWIPQLQLSFEFQVIDGEERERGKGECRGERREGRGER